MKLLFCYDGPIEVDENGNYYSTALNDEMFIRYQCISNNISIAIRVNHITKRKASGKITPLSKEKYNIIECPNVSSLKGILFNKKKCYNILKNAISQSDGIIIRLPSFIGNIAINIANKLGKKYIVEMVGCPWDALWNYNIKGKLVAPIMTIKTKQNLATATNVIYVSNKFLQRRYPSHGKQIACSNVILNNIDEECLNNRLNRLKKMDNSKHLIIGTIGAVNVKYKGQQYVIHAVKELLKKGYSIEYQIVGGGDNSYLLSQAQKYNVMDSIKFLGSKKHEDIFAWLDNLDIYIQPSNQEGLCRSIIEAMSRACPIIASNAGGNPELINNKYIFKKKKYKQIVDRINKMTIEKMIEEAKNNFENSKEYKAEILNERRTNFFQEFKKDCK